MANQNENPVGGSIGEVDHQEMVKMVKTVPLFSQKKGFDLMQNCDLPPPVKIFAGQDEKIASPMKKVYDQEDVGVDEMVCDRSSENEKLELLKALRLSQTRAREAERKVAVLSKEKDDLSNLLLQQSMQLFAYKQWMRMMEFQLSKLNEKQEPDWAGNVPKEEDENIGEKGMTWFVAVAICVGIAGVGFFGFFSSNCH